MERLTKRDTDGQAMMDCEKCKADWTGKHGKPMVDCTALYCRNCLKERLAAYEDTGRAPEEVTALGNLFDYVLEESKTLTGQLALLNRIRDLARADKDGRLFILPLEPGRSMLYQEDFERPWVMKNVAPCIQYQSSVGIVFYMGYNVFRGLVEHGKITPLSPEGEKNIGGDEG